MFQMSSGIQQSAGASFDSSSAVSIRTCNPGTSKVNIEQEQEVKKNNELDSLKGFLSEIKKEHPVDKKPAINPPLGLLQALDTNSEVN